MIKYSIMPMAFLALTACATKPMNFASDKISNVSTIANSPLRNNVSVGNVQGARNSGELRGTIVTNQEFIGNLQESLIQNGMFADKGGDFEVSAEIIKVKPNLSYKVVSDIRYKVTDTKNGEFILDEIISAANTQKFSFNSGKRLIAATEKSLRANVSEFIKRLTDVVGAESESAPSGELIISLRSPRSEIDFLP